MAQTIQSFLRRAVGCIVVLCWAGIAVVTFGQSKAAADPPESEWSKTKEEREERITRAERDQYSIRWIYIGGNTYTRHRDFRKRMATSFNEGYIFTRRALAESIKRIAKMASIYPITFDNVEVILDETRKYIDFTINVRQRSRK